jgi:hypothetical protein
VTSHKEISYPPLIRYLDTNGDGTGTKDANGDYSVTPETFFIQPPAGEIYSITEFLIHIADSSNFTITGFASIAALTNGINVYAKRNGQTLIDVMDGIPIKTNPQLLHLTHRVALLDFVAGGNSLVVSYHSEDFGTSLVMHGDLGDTLEVVLNDDLSGIDDMHFIVHGVVLS